MFEGERGPKVGEENESFSNQRNPELFRRIHCTISDEEAVEFFRHLNNAYSIYER
jgi:hypothetical protein